MIQNEIDIYLNELSKYAPATTVHSHSSTIRSFGGFCERHELTTSDLTDEDVASYIHTKCEEKSSATIEGEIAALSNFLAYRWKANPAVVQARIQNRFRERVREPTHVDTWDWGSLPSQNQYSERSREFHNKVNDLITHLRRTKFGTREHAFVETLVSTANRPGIVLQANLNDVETGAGTILLPLSQTHAIGKYEILQTHTAQLESSAIDALKTYIEYERIDSTTGNARPLFTTHNGRVSANSIRRAVKQVNRETSGGRHEEDSDANTKESPNQQARTLTPGDIWNYALTQV